MRRNPACPVSSAANFVKLEKWLRALAHVDKGRAIPPPHYFDTNGSYRGECSQHKLGHDRRHRLSAKSPVVAKGEHRAFSVQVDSGEEGDIIVVPFNSPCQSLAVPIRLV